MKVEIKFIADLPLSVHTSGVLATSLHVGVFAYLCRVYVCVREREKERERVCIILLDVFFASDLVFMTQFSLNCLYTFYLTPLKQVVKRPSGPAVNPGPMTLVSGTLSTQG